MSNDTIPTSKPTDWQIGTVTRIRAEAPGLRSFMFAFDRLIKHDAGQHYEIRLTAPDGYQAARLYSAASPANGTGHMLQLTIALMPKGEISPYLFNNVHIGDQLEIRGPFGRYFIWNADNKEPLLLIGGGVGVVPLRAIRLSHQQACSETKIKLLYSVNSYEEMVYKYELYPHLGQPPDDVIITFTANPPNNWHGYQQRIDCEMLHEVLAGYTSPPAIYICGPTPMVESVASELVSVGIDPNVIRAERFGSTA